MTDGAQTAFQKIVIASRQSALARLQSYAVGGALKYAWPRLEVEYLFKESLGDKNLDAPLWQMPEKGVFTRDLQVDLEEGRCDMVVHSWKDLPIEMPAGSQIAATMHREDPRDMLLLRRDFLTSLKAGARVEEICVLSSSPRRAYNLESLLKDILPFECDSVRFESIRGNIPTRVGKLLKHPEAHALVLARAAVERLLAPSPVFDSEVEDFQRRLRLDLMQCEWMLVPRRQNPAAPAQGALAVEIRSDREDLRVLLEKIHVRSDFEDVGFERQVLSLFGGGCHQKIGATVSRLGDSDKCVLFLKGQRDSGEVLDFEGFLEDAPYGIAANLLRVSLRAPPSPSAIWPAAGVRPQAFERLKLDPVPERESFGDAPLSFVVGRSEALPVGWKFQADDKVFVAGLDTWKKLAARGVWVHASFEGLGEECLESRLIEPTQRHYKFSHADAPVLPGEILIPTYRLEPLADSGSLIPPGVEECFWMSASLFDEALRREPGLLGRVKRHASGPGHTARLINSRVQAAGGELSLYLGIEHWWRQRGATPSERQDL